MRVTTPTNPSLMCKFGGCVAILQPQESTLVQLVICLAEGMALTLGWQSRHNWTHKITVIILIRQERYAAPTRGTTGCPLALEMPAVARYPTSPLGARCAVPGSSRMAIGSSAVGERWWAKISSAVVEERRAWCTLTSQVRPLVCPTGCGEVMVREEEGLAREVN